MDISFSHTQPYLVYSTRAHGSFVEPPFLPIKLQQFLPSTMLVVIQYSIIISTTGEAERYVVRQLITYIFGRLFHPQEDKGDHNNSSQIHDCNYTAA